ncbi:unnamed protein product [Chilo suppressalis]|uniref:Uncharacterized protein n=1 Tax=Chilo suppressalis TaxID=168631 RepID=A0ABN8E9Y1_CHISP|nr:unnamed protein product [Chilo suppressalis]
MSRRAAIALPIRPPLPACPLTNPGRIPRETAASRNRNSSDATSFEFGKHLKDLQWDKCLYETLLGARVRLALGRFFWGCYRAVYATAMVVKRYGRVASRRARSVSIVVCTEPYRVVWILQVEWVRLF